jgi:hypothetical protein
MPVDKYCNALAFCPKVFTIYFFLPVIVQSKQGSAHGESEVFVILIVPSRHMLWQSAEGALLWELYVILFWDTIRRAILRRVLKNGSMFKVGLSIQRRCICMAKLSVRPQTV